MTASSMLQTLPGSASFSRRAAPLVRRWVTSHHRSPSNATSKFGEGVSDRSLAGGFVFCVVRGYARVGCFHYIGG